MKTKSLRILPTAMQLANLYPYALYLNGDRVFCWNLYKLYETPTICQWVVVKRVLGYIKGPRSKGTFLKKSATLIPLTYSDSYRDSASSRESLVKITFSY